MEFAFFALFYAGITLCKSCIVFHVTVISVLYSISSCMDEELFKHALFESIEKLNNLGLNLKRKQLEALRSAKIFRKNPVKSFQ